MTPAQALLVAAAGLVGGAVNAAAGGGSLITFPALLQVGLPPLSANVSNTVGLVPGYLGGVLGHRNGAALPEVGNRSLLLTGVLGAVTGVVLLLVSPEELFTAVAPVLVLTASALLLVQPVLLPRLRRGAAGSRRVVLGAVFAGAAYGAYFGAALGVLLLAVLGLGSQASFRLANAVKARLSFIVNLVAAALFVVLAPVVWTAVALLAVSSSLGGYLGGDLARRLPVTVLRVLAAALGVVAAVTLLGSGS